MSIFPNGGSNLAYELLKLVQSPRVKSGLGGLRRSLPYASGPLVSNFPSPHRGASPSFGTWHDPVAEGGAAALGKIADIGSQIGNILNQPSDPMMDLYNQLLDQLQQPVPQPTGIDKADLMKQVQAAINPIYDAREHRAQGQSDRARADVKNMYQALSNDYQQLAPQQVAQDKQAEQQVADIYGQLRSNIEGSYGRVASDQADLFKKLGIESALPDVLGKQQQAVTDASNAASENQAQQQQRYADIGQEDASYYRAQAPIAIMSGNEKSLDLLNQLQDYMNQTEAERSSGIQTGYLDQLGQAQSSLAQQQQAANAETNNRQQMLFQMLQSQLQGKQQQQNQPQTPDTFMNQLPSQVQQSVAGAFTQLQRSPEAIYGKVQDPRSPVPGTFVDTTPDWYMAQADKMLQNGQIDAATHQALLMYMQLYFGTGK